MTRPFDEPGQDGAMGKDKGHENTNAVGYGCPPKASQFKPKQSGNPKGRPKGSKNKRDVSSNSLQQMVLKEASRLIEVTDQGQVTPMPTIQTILRTLNMQAMKGNVPAARLTLGMTQLAEHQRVEALYSLAQKVYEYKRNWSAFILEHERTGRDYDIPTPHPDHIIVDPNTLEVEICGPLDKTMLLHWKGLINLLASMEVEASLSGRRSDFVERAMAFEVSEEDDEFLCEHDLEAQERGESISCEQNECYIDTSHYDEDRFMMKYYKTFRERIPFDDPLWKLFGPQYIRNWIDFWFYYGPDAHIEEELLGHNVTLMDQSLFIRPTSVTKLRSGECYKGDFCSFMRAKLSELMEDDWSSRLKAGNHYPRDIEYDKMRYEYETGQFNPDNYIWGEDDDELLSDPEKMKAYMAWS